MESKAKKTTGRGKTSAKTGHTNDKRKAENKANSDASQNLVNTTTAGTYSAPSGNGDDMATLSAAQTAQVFDMSASGDPISDRRATEDARTQAALEPVGTEAALEPIITEDGVIVKNA